MRRLRVKSIKWKWLVEKSENCVKVGEFKVYKFKNYCGISRYSIHNLISLTIMEQYITQLIEDLSDAQRAENEEIEEKKSLTLKPILQNLTVT